MQIQNSEVLESIYTIMDTFSGADNLKFVAFKSYMEKLDRDHSPSAIELNRLVVRFSKFLAICEREMFPR